MTHTEVIIIIVVYHIVEAIISPFVEKVFGK